MSHTRKPLAMTTLPLWINGKSTPSSSARSTDVFNPATGEIIRRTPLANQADIDKAVAAAKAAFPGWRDTPPLRRARILTRYRELMEAHQTELVHLISEEHGKTLLDAAGSLQRGIEVIEFASAASRTCSRASTPRTLAAVSTATRCCQPLGVCAGITPFNFPVMVPLWMFPVAIACGNTFILKPSEKVPSAALRMAELFSEAGLPDGVFNVVSGDKEAVDALLCHPDVAAISSVGSTPIAQYIYETCGPPRQARAGAGRRQEPRGGDARMPTCRSPPTR